MKWCPAVDWVGQSDTRLCSTYIYGCLRYMLHVRRGRNNQDQCDLRSVQGMSSPSDTTNRLMYIVAKKTLRDASRQDLRSHLGTLLLIEALKGAARLSVTQIDSLIQAPPSIRVDRRDLPAHDSLRMDEYGFRYEDEDNENDLSLCRTQSRRHPTGSRG